MSFLHIIRKLEILHSTMLEPLMYMNCCDVKTMPSICIYFTLLKHVILVQTYVKQKPYIIKILHSSLWIVKSSPQSPLYSFSIPASTTHVQNLFNSLIEDITCDKIRGSLLKSAPFPAVNNEIDSFSATHHFR